MSEANNNATSFSSESNLEFVSSNNSEREAQKHQKPADNKSLAENQQSEAFEVQNTSQTESDRSLDQKMDWQKVAHKLREYNRKLLKKVFRLEQELAEIDNRFNKSLEKSQNSDLLLAQQEEELQNYQKQIALLTKHLTTSQKEISDRQITIKNLSQQYELSQQQTAQLERDCTLLQESYSQKNSELAAKEKENKELQDKLSQQQRNVIQYRAELKRYQEQAAVSKPELVSSNSQSRLRHVQHERLKSPQATRTYETTEPALSVGQTYSSKNSKRSIQPWSSNISESKIVLPKTKPQSVMAQRLKIDPSETVKTAAEIATWSASQVKDKPANKSETKKKAKSTGKSKPQSLAAIDLPTFPRPM